MLGLRNSEVKMTALNFTEVCECSKGGARTPCPVTTAPGQQTCGDLPFLPVSSVGTAPPFSLPAVSNFLQETMALQDNDIISYYYPEGDIIYCYHLFPSFLSEEKIA